MGVGEVLLIMNSSLLLQLRILQSFQRALCSNLMDVQLGEDNGNIKFHSLHLTLIPYLNIFFKKVAAVIKPHI